MKECFQLEKRHVAMRNCEPIGGRFAQRYPPSHYVRDKPTRLMAPSFIQSAAPL